ncbi:MAG: hypothetical protein IT426_20960 [Pirellulales bacterium]|nr:hypothetical protein [Pirellulales bacterium]
MTSDSPPQPPPRRPLSEREKADFAIRLLQQLPHDAAAWLLGIHPRTMKDRHNIPQNSNGSYDAKALVKWLLDRQWKVFVDNAPDSARRFYESLGY